MATTLPYPYQSRARVPANSPAANDQAADCDAGGFLMSALPLVLLLAEGLAGAWLWHSLQSMWSWPLIIVFALVASLALSAAAAINLAGMGVALLSLARREGNMISRTLAWLGLAANVAALLPIGWIALHWLV